MATSLPMPEPNRWAHPTGKYLFYIWDTSDVPFVQHPADDVVIITPTFDHLHIWGRQMQEDDDERREGRVFGEWFSTACPGGELGTVDLDEVGFISEQEFSDAYMRGWEPEGE